MKQKMNIGMGGNEMEGNAAKAYVRQISDIARKLSEEKLIKVLSFVRMVKEEPQRASPYLTPREILALAHKRAAELRHQSRPVVDTQYQALLQALQADTQAKGIEAEDFPRGD